MSKNIKKAECALTDAEKFPLESFRERLARRYGLDAVALSGPCEGQNLVDCVVKQLERRWNRIKDRFAGNSKKINKLAIKLAESYMRKDDTKKCEDQLVSLGYSKTAANGITSFMKAYAIDESTDMDMDENMDSVDSTEDADVPADVPTDDAAPFPAEEAPADDLPVEDSSDDFGTPPNDVGEPGELGDAGELAPDMGGGDTVTIELPVELAHELNEAIENQVGDADLGNEGDMGDMGGLDIEVVDVGDEMPPEDLGMGDDMGAPSDDLGMGDDVEVIGDDASFEEAVHDVVPGEPDVGNDKQFVEGGEMEQGGMGHKETETCSACGHAMASKETKNETKTAEAKKAINEAANMRSGHIRKVADQVLKIGPEMSINNTDQLGGHDDKKLGTAKSKAPEEPKPIADGNLDTEGYSAGDKKFQDGKTMGHEEKFDAKEFDKSSSTGGQSSIMGKDESFPEGKPDVPAGSAPIGGEQWNGGDLSTKGTVIATITPKGILVEANGKKFLAPGKIEGPMVAAIQAGLAKLTFDGDGRKFATAAKGLLKGAESSGIVDNVTKIDTSKLEAEKFTNDKEKKPEEGGAKTGKGKGSDYQNEGVTKTDTSKLEGDKFTNDADKKPEDEPKKAAAGKPTKTAKPVEEPKPIADGNLDTEGYSAGDKKFQDGKTMGHEEKFDAKSVDKSECCKGTASLMGKDESLPEGKPDVPAGGGKMGNEEWDGGDLSTKGTVIAEDKSQKRLASDEANDAKIREARLKAASVYVADLLQHGEIAAVDYVKEMEKVAALPVQAIQNLIAQSKTLRTRIASHATETQKETKIAGMSVPYVVNASNNELSLKDRLVREFKLTRTLDQIDDMKN